MITLVTRCATFLDQASAHARHSTVNDPRATERNYTDMHPAASAPQPALHLSTPLPAYLLPPMHAWPSCVCLLQSALVLDSLRLAADFLRPGGTFVTKVFRSRDYTALLYAFRQLFARVDATKPQASRATSTEIFVVCSGYKAPAKIDPRLLDHRTLFQVYSRPAPTCMTHMHVTPAPVQITLSPLRSQMRRWNIWARRRGSGHDWERMWQAGVSQGELAQRQGCGRPRRRGRLRIAPR